MNYLNRILALAGLVLLSQVLYAQSLPEYQTATFLLKDSSTFTAKVNAKQLLTQNVLSFESVQDFSWKLKDVSRIVIDSATYFVLRLENIADTAKVVERVIDGRISVYRSPKGAAGEEIFAEKDKKCYELRIVMKKSKGKKVQVNEYISTLNFLMMDCKAMQFVNFEKNLSLNLGTISRYVTDYNKACGWQTHDSFDFRNATFVLNDSTSRVATVDVRLLLTSNVLQFKGRKADWTLKDVRTVTVDSTTYQVRKLENIADTLKIVEKFIEGKISLFRSPRVTTHEEIFAEKDNKLYQLRIVKRYVKETLFYVNEYSSTLKFLMLDCSEIDQKKVETNVGLSIPEIAKIVGEYNDLCGWQNTLSSRKQIKPKVTYGILGGALVSPHRLSYFSGYFDGNALVTGIFAGPSISVDFRKFFDTHFRYEFLLEKLGGSGEASSGSTVHKHEYDIMQIKNVVAFDMVLHKGEESTWYWGLGTVFQFQVKNDTKVSRNGRYLSDESVHSDKDKFNMAPFGHIFLKHKRMGLRYQLLALSINMKTTELFGFEHRLSVHYDLKTK